MDNNTIDKIFNKRFIDSEKLPDSLNWKKEKAWNKLKSNRIKNTILKFSLSAAAVLIITFSVSLLIQKLNLKDKNSFTTEKYEDEFLENQKREKLKEIELTLSGKAVYKDYCLNCNELLPLESNLINQRTSIEFYYELRN